MRIVVVGGGLSGTIACLQLLRSDLPDLHITLIERQADQLHRGPAYSARVSQQLLNVPAARMGLFPDAVEGFHQWAACGPMPHAAKEDFLPRHRFGDFVHQQFRTAVERHSGRVDQRIGEVTGLDPSLSGKQCLRLADGEQVEADLVLLALGNAPSGDVPHIAAEVRNNRRYIPVPWKPGVLDGIAPQEHVLFVGSGLTMVDLLLSLRDQGHQGPVTVVSRRGFLPCRHAPAVAWSLTCPAPDMRSAELADLLRWLRSEVRQAGAAGVAWPNAIDAARPFVQTWWQALSMEKRRQFLRHLRPFWEVHRHRMPPEVHDRITGLHRSGALRLIAARIQGVRLAGDRLQVAVDQRQGGSTWLAVDRLINCTGPESDVRRLDQPLLTDLLAQGVLCRDELGMGLQCTTEGAVIDRAGRTSNSLFLLGPLCKATLWECTSVPDIRVQVAQLVRRFSRSATLAS